MGKTTGSEDERRREVGFHRGERSIFRIEMKKWRWLIQEELKMGFEGFESSKGLVHEGLALPDMT